MGRLSLTVGIPYFAGSNPSHLAEAIRSVLDQSEPPDRVLLVQDGPVGRDLSEIAAHYCSLASNCRILSLAENRGLAAALNASVRATETDLYARMDSDDVCLPDRFRLQLEYLRRHPDVDILGGAAEEFSSDGHWSHTKVMPAEVRQIGEMLRYRSPFIHPAVVFRKRVFDRIGLYSEIVVEDLELWVRAYLAGVNMANIPQTVLRFRTDGMVGRRRTIRRAYEEYRIRQSIPGGGLRASALNFAAAAFRLLPPALQSLGYQYLR